MYNIIKNALGDALTEQYADALMNATDENYSFSEAFEMKMKKLIRKTDTPYYKYIGYLSAAACAVIVIGCSILLPKLTSSDIPVATTPTETEGIVVTDIVTEAPPTESKTSFTTTPPVSVSEIITEPSSSETTTAPEITSESATTVTTPKSETTVPIIVTTTASSTTTQTEYPYHDENPGMGGRVDENEDDDEDVADDDLDFGDNDDDDDDVGVDSDADEDDEDIGDDSVDITETEDEDEDLADDDDDCCDDDDVYIPPIPTEKTLGEEINTLIGVPLSDSYPYSAVLFNNGVRCSRAESLKEADIMEKARDKEIAEVLENAELIDGTPELSERYVYVCISDTDPNLWDFNFNHHVPNVDASPRNDYEHNFLGKPEEDEEDAADEEDEEVEYAICRVTIYDNGVVEIKSNSSIAESYEGAAYYQADAGIVNTIFERLEQTEPMKTAKNVGDVLSDIADSADDLREVSLTTVRTVYDIRMCAPCENGEYLYELLKKNTKKTVTLDDTFDNDAMLKFTFTSAKTSHCFDLLFYADSTALIKTDCVGYRFDFAVDKAIDVLDYLCELNGKEPVYRYATLADYLEGKNFSGFTYLCAEVEMEGTPGYKIMSLSDENAKAMEKINEIIIYTSKMAYYVLEPVDTGNDRIDASVKNWNVTVWISENYIRIGVNTFRFPSGTTEKILMKMEKYGVVLEPAEDVSVDVDD